MKLKEIENVVIIGAGTMGHSIAQVYAQNGFKVSLIDLNETALDKALTNIKANLATLEDNNLISKEQSEKVLQNLKTSTDLAEFASNAHLM